MNYHFVLCLDRTLLILSSGFYHFTGESYKTDITGFNNVRLYTWSRSGRSCADSRTSPKKSVCRLRPGDETTVHGNASTVFPVVIKLFKFTPKANPMQLNAHVGKLGNLCYIYFIHTCTEWRL